MIGKLKILCIGLMIVMSGFGGLFLMSQTASATELSGIYGTMTWDTAGSPYYVTGDVMISTGETVQIIPDTGPIDIFFNGSFSIFVQGNLYVNGTGTDKVTFTSVNVVPAPGDWTTINTIGPSGNIQMENTTIEYATTGAIIETDANSIKDSEILNCLNYGLIVNGGNNNSIQNTYVHDVNVGIWLIASSENNTIENCNVSDTTSRGIYVQTGSHNTTVLNTTSYVTGTSHFQFDDSDDITVKNCTLGNGADGITFMVCNRANVSESNITQQTGIGIYMEDSMNSRLTENDINYCHEGIEIRWCYQSRIDNNTLIGNNDVGIWVRAANFNHNNTVEDNYLLQNVLDGIAIGGAKDSIVRNNIIENTTDITSAGLNIEGNTERVNVTDNTFIDNKGYGVYLTNGTGNALDNYVYHNNFINNAVHAFDDTGVNFWNTTYNLSPLRGGNYWDNYSDADSFNGVNQDIAGSDGIGDKPYTWIESLMTQDNYPFIEAFSNVPPESEVDPIIEYWHNSNVAVTASATDM
ncbi:MAG: right-handed parallel beta-helix repeat-containing protein, partial [Thermoplasmata archaeon]|nr:right-handed parallel beta-helix repeat-containing protein [Thermoplasmata archaeon]